MNGNVELLKQRSELREALIDVTQHKNMLMESGLNQKAYDTLILDIKQEYLKVLERLEVCESCSKRDEVNHVR